MNIPNELINKIFMYIQSPTALLIKNLHDEYLTTYYDEEYDDFWFSFQESVFNNYNNFRERDRPKYCRCHMKNEQWTQNKCMMCGTIEWEKNNKLI